MFTQVINVAEAILIHEDNVTITSVWVLTVTV